MNCPRCTNTMVMINPRAHICHGCNIAITEAAPARSAEQELADALQREWDR